MLPFISVVIPVRNEALHLPAVVRDLLAQDYPPDRYEIIIADGNSTDGTVREVERLRSQDSFPRVAIVQNPDRLASAGRNAGVRQSRGDLLVFVDGHCRIPNVALLKTTAELLQATGADCLCRPQPLQTPGNSFLQQLIADARATWFGHGRGSTIYLNDYEGPADPRSSGASYRRTLFNEIGYYDESFDACEDVEFNHRVFKAGLKSYFSSRLEVLYAPRDSFAGLWRQMIRYGRGRVRLARKHRDAFTPSQTLPPALVLVVALGFVTAPFLLASTLLLTGVAGLWLAVALVFAVRLARQRGPMALVLAPMVFATIHGGLGVGMWAELLGGALKAGSPASSTGNARWDSAQ